MVNIFTAIILEKQNIVNYTPDFELTKRANSGQKSHCIFAFINGIKPLKLMSKMTIELNDDNYRLAWPNLQPILSLFEAKGHVFNIKRSHKDGAEWEMI